MDIFKDGAAVEQSAGSGPWTEPGVYPVAFGVHRIPLPLPNDGLRAVNVYAIEDGISLVLVDAGWAIADARARLEAALSALDCGLGDVRRFLVTHIHRDHYDQAVAIRREFGTRVSLGAGERENLEVLLSHERRPLAEHLAQLRRGGAGRLADRLMAIFPTAERAPHDWEPPDDWLADGVDVGLEARTLHVVATPGHTRGHVVYVDTAAGLMFAGDHVLPHITPSIGFEPAPAQLPLADFLRSLSKVRQLPDLRLLPAHGPVGGGIHARIDELVTFHERRLAQTMAAVDAGACTALEVGHALTWTRHGRSYDDLDLFNQMLAINETSAHLDLLVAQGRLTASIDDGVRHFEMPS
jgi:glyoxylase-like metal-dependent hydrolase (beta-lactamase superfamily II)